MVRTNVGDGSQIRVGAAEDVLAVGAEDFGGADGMDLCNDGRDSVFVCASTSRDIAAVTTIETAAHRQKEHRYNCGGVLARMLRSLIQLLHQFGE